MPNPVNNLHGEQWEVCDVCARIFPYSQLAKQKGLNKCRQCTDNLDVEYRDRQIAKVLDQPTEEGVDQRGERFYFDDDLEGDV